MRIRWFWVLLGLSLGLNVAFVGGFVYARFLAPSPASPPPGLAAGYSAAPPLPVAELVRELQLDDGQRRQFRGMLQETRRAVEPLVREQLGLRDALVGELRKPSPDPAAVERLLERAGSLRAATQKEVVRRTLAFGASLRPEQQQRLRDIVVARTLAQVGAGGPRLRRDPPAPRRD